MKLAENKETIEAETGAKVIISSIEVINICRDKYKTADFLMKEGFLSPKYITSKQLETGDYAFPLFIKPLNGSSSINAFKVNNERELEFFTYYIDNYILQEFAALLNTLALVFSSEYVVSLFLALWTILLYPLCQCSMGC